MAEIDMQWLMIGGTKHQGIANGRRDEHGTVVINVNQGE